MDEEIVNRAAELLRAEGLVALPTETVYGLGANALDAEAVARVFEAKDRPRFDPLIVHVADVAAARALVTRWPDAAETLAAEAWPGPLTLVLPKSDAVPDLVTAGLPSVALRVPDHPLTLAILRRAGVPVAAPSANRFGGVSPTCAEHVREELGDRVDLVVDGGPCRTGLESTVLSLLDERPRLLRPGGFPLERIEELIGPVDPPPPSSPDDPGGRLGPGLLSRHYATRTPLVLAGSEEEAVALATGRRAGLLRLAGPPAPLFATVEDLSPTGDLVEAAASLFAAMRRLDDAGLELIVALPPPESGLGRAIADRLRRAAAPSRAEGGARRAPLEGEPAPGGKPPFIRWRRALLTAAGLSLALALVVTLGAVHLVRGPVAWTRPAWPAAPPPSIERLRADVELLAGRLVPRSWRDRAHLEAAAAHVAGVFRENGLGVELQSYATDRGSFTNVVGRREGTDPSAGVVVLTAHYDAPGSSPGADDNASSVAVLLEVARTLGTERGERTLLLAATSTEEPPFFSTEGMGAHDLASRLKEAGEVVHVMAALDCVGFYSEAEGSQSYPATMASLLFPTTGDFLAVVGDLEAGPGIRVVKRGLRAQRELDVYSFRGPRNIHGIMLSDHYWFRELGLPGVMITDTAFMRNPNYHELSDTPETLDYRKLAAVVTGIHGVIRESGAGP